MDDLYIQINKYDKFVFFYKYKNIINNKYYF